MIAPIISVEVAIKAMASASFDKSDCGKVELRLRVGSLELDVEEIQWKLQNMVTIIQTERNQNLWMVRFFELFKIYRVYRKLRFNSLAKQFSELQENFIAENISAEVYESEMAVMSIELPAKIDVMVNLCDQRHAEQSVETPQDQIEFIARVSGELEQAPADIAIILGDMLAFLSTVTLTKNIPKCM